MARGPRRGRWPALPALLLAVLSCAGCTAPVPRGDHWGVRRIPGRVPAIASLSEVNRDKPAPTAPLRPVLLRAATKGPDAVTVRVDEALAATWLPYADRVEPELRRALDWLARIDATDPRGLQLDITLVDRDVHRHERRRHPATDAVRIDLLVPADREPASRSAGVAAALAIALHETVHALRDAETDRAEDEYRASLVESCYLLDVARAGDVIELDGGTAPGGDGGAAAVPVGPGDFTVRHSREAAARVLADLRRAAGVARIGDADFAALQRARAFCHQRLRVPAAG